MVHQVQPVQPVLSRPVAPVSLPGAAGTPVPHPVAPIPHLPASSVPRMASSGSQDAMKIPTISSPPRPRLPIQQNIGMRRPQVPMQYPPVSSRPMLVPQPPQMVRAPQFPGPPRPAGIVQPISASRGFPPSRPGGPVSYPRGMFHFLLSELGNMKHSQQFVCVCTMSKSKGNCFLGSIPTAVQDMSPHSSPEQMVGCMTLLLSITTNEIVACSNRAGSINLFSWSTFQMADAKVLYNVACDSVLEHFKLKKPKIFTKKSISLEKLLNGR